VATTGFQKVKSCGVTPWHMDVFNHSVKTKTIRYTMKQILIISLLIVCKLSFAKIPLILLSIDGFSNEYLSKFKPKNMLLLANEGVLADALTPVFPSKTFPNHLSIITGRYPNQHGIVHNRFYHRDLDKYYHLGAAENEGLWLTAKPLWELAEKNNITSAIYFWPESQAKIDGKSATYNMPYKHETPNKKRFDKILTWLNLPLQKRPEFIMGYFSTIDSAGHSFGPNSKEVREAIVDFDQLLGDFLAKIDEPVNIVLVSDHGMTNVSHSIKWQEYITENKKLVVSNGGTQLYLYAKNVSALNDARSQLTKMPKDDNKFTVHQNNNFPKHWQFIKNSPVMPDIILNAIPPYVFESKNGHVSKATHGYDPQLTQDLEAIFIANGPAFKSDFKIGAFENIHIFPLLVKILNIPEVKNVDGKLSVLKPILK